MAKPIKRTKAPKNTNLFRDAQLKLKKHRKSSKVGSYKHNIQFNIVCDEENVSGNEIINYNSVTELPSRTIIKDIFVKSSYVQRSPASRNRGVYACAVHKYKPESEPINREVLDKCSIKPSNGAIKLIDITTVVDK